MDTNKNYTTQKEKLPDAVIDTSDINMIYVHLSSRSPLPVPWNAPPEHCPAEVRPVPADSGEVQFSQRRRDYLKADSSNQSMDTNKN
jgi:hypothetical protein